MKILKTLDPLVQDLAMCLMSSVNGFDWLSARLITVIAPVSGVCSQECMLSLADGRNAEGWYPENDFLDHLRQRSREHWRSSQDLGQPHWYKMIVTVERSGKFSVDFEYKDDYQEGDIMKRG